MIEKMLNFNHEKWSIFLFVSLIDLLVLYLAVYLFIQAKNGYGFNVKTFKNGHWGKLTGPKKTTSTERRTIWILSYLLLGFFLFYAYVISRDSKLWS